MAQFNDAGRLHVGVGGAFGAHATSHNLKYHFTFLGTNFTYDSTTTDGAVTATLPVEVDYGIARFMSVGLYLQPGSYLDSSATESNSVILAGIQPKFYVLNKDRFAILAALQLGFSRLHFVRDAELGEIEDSRYSGFQWGLGTGMSVGFGDHFGMNVMLRYVSTNMPLREYTINGPTLAEDIEARLRTGGVLFQVGFAARFGGD